MKLIVPPWVRPRAVIALAIATAILAIAPLLHGNRYWHNQLTETLAAIATALAWNWLGGYLGGLGDVFGAVAEEWQPLDQPGGLLLKTTSGEKIPCHDFCDLLHVRGAEVLAQYAGEFFAGRPAVTRHRFGSGQAVYLGTGLERGHPQALCL